MTKIGAQPPTRKRILMLGATGTIGRATLTALQAQGHEVVCIVRPHQHGPSVLPASVEQRFGDVTDPTWLRNHGFADGPFDTIVSCLASRTGTPESAWEIDFKAHSDALAAGQAAGVAQMVLLSAICVQKPVLAFQHAKLAFEKQLAGSGLTYSIVRPTAYFKSLSGQIERLKKGKPFLVFGDGRITRCKPISDADLASYIAECVTDESRQNRILPIGGPGPAISPLEQGTQLFDLLDLRPRFRHVPVSLLDGIVTVLAALGHVSPAMKDKAELARIGRYYATESMLVLDPLTGRYDADATPSTGTDRLFDHYARLIRGEIADERGAHAVF